MAQIGGSRALYTVLREAQSGYRALMQDAANRIGGVLLRYTDRDGLIPLRASADVRIAVGALVDDLFTGTEQGRRGRHAFARDGITPLAPYPRLLNGYLARVVREAVEPHGRYLQRTMPDDVQARLSRAAEVREMAVPVREQGDEEFYPKLRIFRPNPLAQYDAPHTWVDPNGYRLSDRIWRADEATRRKLDNLLAEMISKGYGATDIAQAIEQYLVPGRGLVRTTRPYVPYRGPDGQMVDPKSLSYDAMRLARSEITRAHSWASKASAIANPYVDTMNWNLSAMHPKVDICDSLAAGSPYPVDSTPVPVQDSHPHCLCNLTPNVSRTPAQVTQELREALIEAERENLRPFLTPLQTEDFISYLLGEVLANFVSQVVV